MSDKQTFGDEEGAVCWRNGCQGVIALCEQESCTCFLSAPCSPCTEHREYCPTCNWQAKDEDEVFNGFVVKYADPKLGIFGALKSWEPRPLDPRKIDYRVRPHSNSSQICEGVYPEGTTRADVEGHVKGTFGGRFNHFGNGKFEYVAYTD